MLFHTWAFLVFFLVFYPVYLAIKKTRCRIPWLLLASYVFYGWWNPLFLFLILFSTTVDYCAVSLMAVTRFKKPWLSLSIITNLGLLGFFKYGAFITSNLNELLTSLNIPYEIPEPDVLLPVGISFFIFQSMSYTIDFYRGKVEREHGFPGFIRYATFVSLFPQLVAGPIERAKNLLPQLHKPPEISLHDVSDGMSLFVVGLFKKVALADYLSLYADPVFNNPANYQSPSLIIASFAFAWQIYFDFSGYTDMARGIGRMMGIHLMINFNNPYLATSLGDFWRRWHISLSTWFKDYVYIPLGGNRKGSARTYINMCLTMVISGLWHGAMWTFVIWGALHAVGRVVTRAFESTSFYREKVPTFAKQVFVFGFVTFAWIFFRAKSLDDALLVITRIFSSAWKDPRCPLLMLGMVFSIWIYQFIHESRFNGLLALSPVRIGLVVLMLFYIAVSGGSGENAFIYFQF